MAKKKDAGAALAINIGQPHQLDVALRLALQPSARLDTIQRLIRLGC